MIGTSGLSHLSNITVPTSLGGRLVDLNDEDQDSEVFDGVFMAAEIHNGSSEGSTQPSSQGPTVFRGNGSDPGARRRRQGRRETSNRSNTLSCRRTQTWSDKLGTSTWAWQHRG